MKHNESLIVAGSIAMRAAAELVQENEGELRTRFPSFITEPVKNYRDVFAAKKVFAPEEEASARVLLPDEEETGICFGAALGYGGIFNYLWSLGEALDAGMEIDILKIPIRQETVEICEYFDIDPYYADSKGAYLLVSSDSGTTLEWLRAQDIYGARIGRLTDGRARVIHYPDHTRYLDRPQKDSMERYHSRPVTLR